MSNGGDDILRYRVELDPTSTFENPIVEDFICPTRNKKTIWKVETSVNGGIIDGGSFKLLLEVNGRSYKTDSIPYDAVALSQNETGTLDKFDFTVSLVNGSSIMITSPPRNIEKLVFKGDRLQFDTQYSLYQMYEVEPVTEKSANFSRPFIGLTESQVNFSRIYGGRGDPSSSRVHCRYNKDLCDSDAVAQSGSMQSKIEDLKLAVKLGVLVDIFR